MSATFQKHYKHVVIIVNYSSFTRFFSFRFVFSFFLKLFFCSRAFLFVLCCSCSYNSVCLFAKLGKRSYLNQTTEMS